MTQTAQQALAFCLKVPMHNGRLYSDTCDACEHAPTSVMVHGSSLCKKCCKEQTTEARVCSTAGCKSTTKLMLQLPEQTFQCETCLDK